MAKIKVTRGACGIKYADQNGTARFKTVTEADGYVECDDAQAARFVRLGVAKYQEAAAKAEDNDSAQEQNQQEPAEYEPEKLTGHLDADQLATMTNDQLKNLAVDLGVDVSGCKKKADLIAAIVAVEVEAENGDELPELGAADPE